MKEATAHYRAGYLHKEANQYTDWTPSGDGGMIPPRRPQPQSPHTGEWPGLLPIVKAAPGVVAGAAKAMGGAVKGVWGKASKQFNDFAATPEAKDMLTYDTTPIPPPGSHPLRPTYDTDPGQQTMIAGAPRPSSPPVATPPPPPPPLTNAVARR